MEGEAYWEIEWQQSSESEIIEKSFEKADILKTWNEKIFQSLKE